jgi:hypothetical protein
MGLLRQTPPRGSASSPVDLQLQQHWQLALESHDPQDVVYQLV